MGPMAAPSTHVSLLSRVRAGDASSWHEFDERYRDLILRYCRRRGLQECDAEDVRQALMMRLSSALREFRYRPTVGRFRDYLRTCARNAIANHFSRQNGLPGSVSVDEIGEQELGEASDTLDDAWEAEWRGHHLRLAMAKARKAFERQSIEVFERLAAGDRPEDVAASFALGVPAVYKVKQRMMDFLRERVDEQLADEEFPERG